MSSIEHFQTFRIPRPKLRTIEKEKGKFWIYLAVIVLYLTLIGIVVLVLLLAPKYPDLSDETDSSGFKDKNNGGPPKQLPPADFSPDQKPIQPSASDPFWDLDPRRSYEKEKPPAQEIQDRSFYNSKILRFR